MTTALQVRKNKSEFQRISDWIFKKESILILTHQRPDGDAIGSLVGLLYALKDNDIACSAYIQEHVPERYQELIPEGLLVGTKVDFSHYDALVCLDTANEKRLAIPNNLIYNDLVLPCCNLDHHVDNSRYGEIFCIESSYAATAELLAQFIQDLSLNITSTPATMLLMGIITDTGGFRFNNTTADTLKIAAWLIENGADYNLIMRKVYFEEPANKVKFTGKLCEKIQFAFGNRVAYFFLTPELLSSYNIDEKDTEDLVDIARAVKGVEIACRIQKVKGGVRFSLRSKNEAFSVNDIAHELGGGGHRMAAGAFVKNIDLEKGEELFLNCAKKIVQDK